jgi:alpha-tubulin suppressor-like RCC1 family protein
VSVPSSVETVPDVGGAVVTDQYGNVINGAAITWNDSIGGGGTLSANTGLTSAAGTASTTWTLGRRLGQQLIRAKLTGRTETVTATATATVGFSDVIAGNAMACGIAAATNAVYCWGAGNDGQLGKGGTTSSNAPSVAVAQTGDTLTGLILQARQMAGGRNGFCALTLARTLYCWGRQLGAASQPSPTAITLTGPGGAGVLPNAAFMGEDFGCLLTLAGSAFCGGNNLNGQLGNGGTPTGTTSGTWVSVTTPAGFTTFSSMATGRAHMCGIPRFNTASSAVTQAAYCWGQNSEGQVGDATVVDKGVVTIVTMPAAGTRFDSTTIATGAQHSCAVESANSVTAGGGPGTAWCWGGNGFGQLGTGDNARRTSPSLVLAPAGGAVAYARLYAGEHHTCGLTSAGAAYCWGRNDSGQLGNGTTTSSSTPVAVGGGPYRTLSLGENFTCGVTGTPGTSSQTAGTIFCWGNNQFGQLGIGNNTSVLSPASGRVSGQP